MKPFLKNLLRKMFQTSSSLKWRLSWWICKTRCFKPASASNEAFLKWSVQQDASNQIQPQMKPFLKDLWSKMLQTSSSLKWIFSSRICKGKSFKPASALNEAFLKGSVKQDASNQLQPQMNSCVFWLKTSVLLNKKLSFSLQNNAFLKKVNVFN